MKTVSILIPLFLLAQFSLHATCQLEASLTGEVLSVGNLLKWSTLSEEDHSLFVVEKSLDGEQYEAIGEVKAAGNSKEKTAYQFLDLKAQQGLTHYRLRYVDIHGAEGYSASTTIQKLDKKVFFIHNMSASLNPGVSELQLELPEDASLTYTIKNTDGQQMHQEHLEYTAGIHQLYIDLSKTPVGVYEVSLESGDDKETILLNNTQNTQSFAQDD